MPKKPNEINEDGLLDPKAQAAMADDTEPGAVPADDDDFEGNSRFTSNDDDNNDGFDTAGIFDPRLDGIPEGPEPELKAGDSDGDDDVSSEEEPEPAAPKPEAAPKPKAKAAEPAEPAEPEKGAPQATQQQPPEPAPPSQEAQPHAQQQRKTQEEVNAEFDAWVSQASSALEKHYALSEEQATEFENDPAAVLPKLASRLHMEVLAAATGYIAQLIPDLVMQVQAQQRSNQELEEQFYGQFPALRGHEETVTRLAMAARQFNPQMSNEDLMNQIGVQASVYLKLPVPGYEAAAGDPPQPKPAARPAPPPPTPAAARGRGAAAPPPANPRTGFASDAFVRQEEISVDD